VRTDVKTPSKARATVAHPKGETTTVVCSRPLSSYQTFSA
jgi:hypothetical protein